MMKYTFCQDIGGRKEQEDAVEVFESKNHLFMVLADGMGGHEGGAIASSILLETAKGYFSSHPELLYSPFKFFTSIIQESIYRLKEQYIDTTLDPNTTLVMALIVENTLYYCYIGDSRLYLFEKKKGLIFRTRDDSIPEILFQQKKITEEEISTHSEQNVLTKSLNMKSTDRPSLGKIKLSKSKEYRILLASDGLWAMIDAINIYKELFYSSNTLEVSTKNLLKIAKNRAGKHGDNISIATVVIERKHRYNFRILTSMILFILLLLGFVFYFLEKEPILIEEQNKNYHRPSKSWNTG